MRFLTAVLATLLVATPLAAMELGAGVAYYTTSDEATPFIGVTMQGCGTTTFITWAREGSINHAGAQASLDVYKVEDIAVVYGLGGAGFAWDEWNAWSPELTYGIGIQGDVAKFTGRATWVRTETGGKDPGTNCFLAGIYVGK